MTGLPMIQSLSDMVYFDCSEFRCNDISDYELERLLNAWLEERNMVGCSCNVIEVCDLCDDRFTDFLCILSEDRVDLFYQKKCAMIYVTNMKGSVSFERKIEDNHKQFYHDY